MNVNEVLNLLASMSDSSFSCPNCGITYDANDSEISQHVITYHGEEPHGLTCDECGVSFWVHEDVRRSFETTMTPAPPE